MIKVLVKVLRDEKEIMIESRELVRGDIVLLEPGNKISADLRVIESKNLTVNESILTGESINANKNNLVLTKESPLGDRTNILHAGTSVITGRGKAIVVEVAANTEFGKIADKVAKTEDSKSPLTIRMEKFSKQISVLIAFVAIIIAVLLIRNGQDLQTIFLSVIALAVSAMPEGLPLALTMALTIGSTRMSKKNVIVKKLTSVEGLGSCTVIASDKTGTLTVNEQTAKEIILPDGEVFEVSGTGYNDNGKITNKNGKDINLVNSIILNATVNSEANLTKEKKKWIAIGDSIDVAFDALALKAGINKKDYKLIGNIPYESENKYSATFYKNNDVDICTVKGSVEKVLSFCSHSLVNGSLKPLDTDAIIKQNEDLAKQGYRIIAIASKEIKKELNKTDFEEKDIPKLNFDGLVAFIDPIREETIDSIKECKSAGIKVVMITGDHPLTAYEISRQLGIADTFDKVTNTDEVEEYFKKGEKYFDDFVASKTVFTRVTPLQKLEIVESYKRQKEYVAVTGDGVNDAPAIKAANIGIAMGSGTDVAKETASMIITDDNFLSIVAAVIEGRIAYSNIRKVSYFLLSCGLAEVFFFVLSTLFGMEMPLVAIQLLWLNVVTNGLQDIALSLEREEKDIMNQPPRNTSESVFDKVLIKEMLLSGAVIGVIVFGAWYYLINVASMDVEHARGYIMALMVFVQNVHVLNCRSEHLSVFNKNLGKNILIPIAIVSAIILQIIVMEVPVLSRLLSTYAVPPVHMVYLFLIALPILLVMEVFKLLNKKKVNN